MIRRAFMQMLLMLVAAPQAFACPDCEGGICIDGICNYQACIPKTCRKGDRG